MHKKILGFVNVKWKHTFLAISFFVIGKTSKEWDHPKLPPTLPQPFDENLTADGHTLEREAERFVQKLIRRGVLNSYHRDATSGDMDPKDFEEDLTHKVMSAINIWIQTVNNRGNRENGPGMIK